jgi:pilus assembly protein FimV
MLRKLGLSIAIASALLVGKANALGMGEIRVKSALNEPLHAEIALFQVKNLSPLQIKSKMADLNDFALSGLATQRALSNVRFQIRVRANGTGRIILTSKLPVTEPFMNFLVEVNWPNGRLIREYTLLLDPPATQAIQNQRNFNVVANNSSNSKAVTKPAKIKVPKRAAPKKTTTASQKVKKGQYYIDPKDTLWDVAIATRPKKSVTPQQMMVLIQRKNPHAFPNANINVMKAKSVIDLPTQAEIDALSVKDAQDEVTRQTKLWKSGNLPKIVEQAAPSTQAAPATAADKKDKTKETAKVETEQKSADQKDKKLPTAKADAESLANKKADVGKMVEKGMLDVITPEEAARKKEMQAKAEAMALAASKDSDKIADLLRNNSELGVKLALSEESIDKLKRDNTELNDKLNTIVKQLDDINRLISLKDEQLAAMQDERENAEKEQQKQTKQEQDKSWLDRLLENPLGMAAAGVGWLFAILAGVFLLLRRKKKEVVPVEDTKSEPSISMPEEIVEEADKEQESLSEDAAQEFSSEIEDDDLDLDLDLDMDMGLEESLPGSDLDYEGDEAIGDDDLAAELEAQLDVADDDDFDLDGIDSSEFDLGDDDDETDAEKQALAEFAAAMEETAPDDEQDDSSDDQVFEESESSEDELLEALDDSLVESSVDEELDLDSIPDQVTSLDELEALEEEDLLEESLAQIDVEDELEIELDEDLDEAVDVQAEEQALEQLDSETGSDDQELSLELEDDLLEGQQDGGVEAEQIADIESDLLEIEMPEDEQQDSIPMDSSLDDLLNADLDVESQAEGLSVEAAAESVVQDDDDLLAQMDDGSLDEVLEELDGSADESSNEVSSADDILSDEQSSEVLSEEISEEMDELLSSTDDDIAFDAVEPQFDTDNEEDIDLLAGEDGVRMKLDLARAYIEMGDSQGAQDIINEVIGSGDEEQQKEANDLLQSMQS